MDATAATYAIIVCTRCRDPRSGALAADSLLSELQQAGPPDGFTIETVACMAACARPLAVAFRAAQKATYLFGEIQAETDAAALREFGAMYRGLPDGWCSEGQRPQGLRGKIIARIPVGLSVRD